MAKINSKNAKSEWSKFESLDRGKMRKVTGGEPSVDQTKIDSILNLIR